VGDVPAVEELKGARIFTVGIGTTSGGQIPTYDDSGKFTGYLRDAGGVPIVSRLIEETLRSLAEKGGGRYVQYTGNDAAIADLARDLRAMESIEPFDEAGRVPDERSAPFVALGVAALLLEWLISDRRGMPAPRGVRGTTPARRRRRLLGLAIGSTLLWATACGDEALSNETANALFASGDYRGALAAYRDLQTSLPDSPELAVNAANALHKLGEYPRALPEYARAIEGKDLRLRAIAQYDRGNTLFRMGRFEDARDAYREVLRIDPSDRDAKFDLEIIDRLLSGRPAVPGQQPGPGQGQPGGSPNAGQGGGQSSAPNASGQPRPGQSGTPAGAPGDPSDSGTPNGSPPPDLRPALDQFRRGLTVDEALRVLDALRGEQRGVGTLLEGPRRGVGQEY
jgi:tetratricopeptide (TPR) repeat protein